MKLAKLCCNVYHILVTILSAQKTKNKKQNKKTKKTKQKKQKKKTRVKFKAVKMQSLFYGLHVFVCFLSTTSSCLDSFQMKLY